MSKASNLRPVTRSASQAAFLSWIKGNHPNFYAQLQQRAGLGDLSSTFSKVLDGASNLLSQYVTGKEQLALLKLNIARAKAGQMPITNIPTVNVQPALGSGVPKWVWLAGGAALLWFILKD